MGDLANEIGQIYGKLTQYLVTRLNIQDDKSMDSPHLGHSKTPH